MALSPRASTKELLKAIEELRAAAHKRRRAWYGTAAYREAAAVEKRLNERVMELAREHSKTSPNRSIR
jgi:hypothetical protein